MTYDFVVIGAGMSGIASSITLAQKGFKVALLEKEPRTAPLLRGFSRQGIQFDTGFHYTGGLGAGGQLELFFRYLGLSDKITSFAFNDDGFDLFACAAEGFEFRFPSGYDRIRHALCTAFPREGRAIESYLSQVRAISDGMPYQNLDAPVNSESQLQRVFGPTLKETLDALTDNAVLKALLCMHGLLYGVPSDEVAFAQHAVVVGNYYQSASGIRGGGASLAAACDARLKEVGVDLFCGTEVKGITVDREGAFSGVGLASGEMISGRQCIATIHPGLLLKLIPEGVFRPAYRKRLASLDESISAFLAFAACGDPLPSLSGTNLYLLPDAASIHDMGRQPVGVSPLYISGAYANGEAEPSGFIGIFPASFSGVSPWLDLKRGPRPASYREFKKEAVEVMQRQLERLAPGLAATVRTLEVSTPLTLRDYCGSPGGGLYGVKHMVGQYNPLPATKMKGLFLAGQALVAPGVMGAVLSGLLACGTIVGHEQMRKDLKGCC